MTTNYTIRVETPADYAEVSNLVRESFWNVYAPGCTEHYVIEHLRKSEGFIKELSFVMEKMAELLVRIFSSKPKLLLLMEQKFLSFQWVLSVLLMI